MEISNLQERCSEALVKAGITFQRDQDGALRIPARSQEVGDLVIAFDNDEISVFIGELPHCHFTPGSVGDVSATDQNGECVREAARFVLEVLDDRSVIWTHPHGAGGCYEIGSESDPAADAPLPGVAARSFLWSGRHPR